MLSRQFFLDSSRFEPKRPYEREESNGAIYHCDNYLFSVQHVSDSTLNIKMIETTHIFLRFLICASVSRCAVPCRQRSRAVRACVLFERCLFMSLSCLQNNYKVKTVILALIFLQIYITTIKTSKIVIDLSRLSHCIILLLILQTPLL